MRVRGIGIKRGEMMEAIKTPISKPSISWPILPDDFVLPDDPVENTDQPPLAAALRQPLTAFPELMENALVVSNFALCAAIDDRTICKAPDWMYVQPVNPTQSNQPRRSYTPHTEGAIPTLVMEFLSATYGDEYSVEHTEGVGKWYFYEQVIQVPYYAIFRPTTGRLEVYALKSGRYSQQIPNEFERYWIEGLNLYLAVWEGTHEGRTGYWLRWVNSLGDLLPFSEERAEEERQRADEARQRAEEERQRADEASQQAEEERQRADEARQRAEEASQQAEEERQRAEEARQRTEEAQALLEQERARSQALAARLREMGIDLEKL
jgi:Putative restriction endonuclease